MKDQVWKKLIIDTLTAEEYKKVAHNPVKLFKDRLRTLKSDYKKREQRESLKNVVKRKSRVVVSESPQMEVQFTKPNSDPIERVEMSDVQRHESFYKSQEDEQVQLHPDNEVIEVMHEDNGLVEFVSSKIEDQTEIVEDYLEFIEEADLEEPVLIENEENQGVRPEPVVVPESCETVQEEIIAGPSFQEEQKLLAKKFNMTTVKTVLTCPRCNYCLEGVSMF